VDKRREVLLHKKLGVRGQRGGKVLFMSTKIRIRSFMKSVYKKDNRNIKRYEKCQYSVIIF